MNIGFTARRTKVDPRLRDIVEKKLTKLSKVLPKDAQAHVVVRGEKKTVSVEVTVVGRQRTWTATETGIDQETAGHAVLDRIAAQAKKTKARVKEDKKHRPSAVRSLEVWHPGAAAEKREIAPTGARREPIAVRPMFEEDALDAFSSSSREVLLYRDLTDDAFRVLYRRRDGSLGLLIPV